MRRTDIEWTNDINYNYSPSENDVKELHTTLLKFLEDKLSKPTFKSFTN